jgi:hypothetical protein
MTEPPFDRYVFEKMIPEEHWPEAFVEWLAEQTGESPVDYGLKGGSPETIRGEPKD